MKTSLLLAAVLGLAGCATGVHWERAGADRQALNADSESCSLESWTASPEGAGVSEGPARAYPRTPAEVVLLAERDKARRGTFEQCMQQRGWQRQPA